jgi:DNA-binding CsgD family transcriptional regulator
MVCCNVRGTCRAKSRASDWLIPGFGPPNQGAGSCRVAQPSREVYGREAESRTVAAFLDAARMGPTALLIEGPAGIGKTTLWIELQAGATSRDYLLLSCRPTEAESAIAFLGVGDLLEKVPSEAVDSLPTVQKHAIDVARLRVDAGTVVVDKRTLLVATLALFREVASGQSTIIAIDDVQWLDVASSSMLEYVVRRLTAERIGIAVTRRAGHGTELPLGIGTNDSISSEAIAVGPLDRTAISRVLHARLGITLAPPALKQLQRVSGGNPFYALEIGRELARRGTGVARGEPFPIADNLRELVRDRIGRLSRPARDVVLAVAALSLPTVELLRMALVNSTEGLEEAVNAGIVEIYGDTVRLGHPLLGSVCYADQRPPSRRALHRRLAELVADPDERARHLALAAVGPDPVVAEALEEAAQRTRRRGSPEGAAHFWRQAYELTPSEQHEDRWRRAFAIADNSLTAGDPGTARTVLEDLLVVTPDPFGRVRVLSLLSSVVALQRDWYRAGDLIREALKIGGDDPETGLRSESGLAWITWFNGDLREAVRHNRAAIEVAERIGSPLLSEVLGEGAFFTGMTGERRTDDIMARALEIEDRTAGQRLLNSPARWSVPLLMWDNRFDDAIDTAERDYALALKSGDEHVLPNILDGLAELSLLAGRWDAAARYAAEQRQAALETNQPLIEARALQLWGHAEVLLGGEDSAEAKAGEALGMIEGMDWPQTRLGCLHVLGLAAQARGDARRAHEFLGEAVERARTAGIGEPGVLRFVPDEVEALVALGQLEAAEEVLHPFAERAEVLRRYWAVADVARCAGQIRAARGDQTGALIDLEQAVRLRETSGQPFELGRSLLALGRQRRRLKRKADARRSLQGALSLFESLGAVRWAANTRIELQRIGGRAPAPDALTAGERAVAQLARQGRTNREIAATTFMSVRTVEAHLTRIYSKLGVRSRTELATLGADQINPAGSPDFSVLDRS